MGKQTPITTTFELPDGSPVVIETGKLATQADGSVVVKIGNTMLFCSVVSAKEMKEGQSFFPLSVDYQEKFAAAGRIPGNFFRREARLSDYEILTSRLVDRAIRPLFPDGYLNETQVIINLISADKETLPDAYAALAASAALVTSNIRFAGPISEVRVAKINGEYHVNPTRTQLKEASLEIIVAADMDNIMMVEGEAKECDESEILEALRVGHEAIKVQCKAQLDLAEKVGDKALVKRELVLPEVDEALLEMVKSLTVDKILEVSRGKLDKKARKKGFEDIKNFLEESLLESKGEEFMEENWSKAKEYFGKVKKETIRNMVLDESVRLDGRRFDEVRDIWCEIDYLPAAHGSAIFNRGETQSLTSLTLGSKLDEKMIDNALDHYMEDFILHYNFPALSVGEIKPMRGPGRREVGHANLAARSLKQVLPAENPYTIRLVSDILESNGSSSMATVCAGSLALMDGGVPITKQVSGVAMGMIAEGGKYAILSDILGDEDALGDMDFKVTGTADGICACQMDIKIEGLSYELLEKALQQAKEARLHILEVMNEAINTPRADYKEHAPRIEEIRIPSEFIGAVIGSGGKVIQEIQKETGAVISIEEEGNQGVVNISSADKKALEAAKTWVENIVRVPEEGEEFEGKVVKMADSYMIVEFLPGKAGMLHISEVSYERIGSLAEFFSEGDAVPVKLLEVDNRSGKYRLSRKALLPKPEGYVEPPKRERRRDDRNDRRGGNYRRRDDRGGRRNDRNNRD